MKTLSITPKFIKKPWGGKYIKDFFSIETNDLFGEAFLVSTLKNEETKVDDVDLSAVLGDELTFLVKLIDARENLSVQVHPNDESAKLLDGAVGKTECWLIVDHTPGAGVYLGLKDGVNFEKVFRAINEKKSITEFLNFIEVKKNDFLVVPAGTIHAIGAGVRLIEFQQSSGITYRIWDWERQGRELHLQKARISCLYNQKAIESNSFLNMRMGDTFFSHADFSLKKVSDTIIECNSDKCGYKIDVDVLTLSIKLSKHSYL